jgi:hypothetical protein
MQMGRLKIVCEIYVNDNEFIKRTMMERLFTRPWKPLESVKSVYRPRGFQLGDTIFVSPRTFHNLTIGTITAGDLT